MKIEVTGPMKNVLQSLLILAVLVGTIVTLELLLLVTKTPDYLVPTPSSVFREFALDVISGRVLKHMIATVSETLIGFFIAFTLGISLAVAVNRSKIVRKIIQPYITAFQAMPKVALAPIIVLWFGFGIASKIVLVTFIAFFLVFVSALNGLQSLSASVLELMRSWGATEGQILRKVRLPNALPFIFAGAEAALLYSLTAAVVGEFVGAGEGLGYLIQLRSAQLKADSSFAVILLLIIIAMTLQSTLIWIKNRVLFWTAKT